MSAGSGVAGPGRAKEASGVDGDTPSPPGAWEPAARPPAPHPRPGRRWPRPTVGETEVHPMSDSSLPLEASASATQGWRGLPESCPPPSYLHPLFASIHPPNSLLLNFFPLPHTLFLALPFSSLLLSPSLLPTPFPLTLHLPPPNLHPSSPLSLLHPPPCFLPSSLLSCSPCFHP